MWRQTQRYKSVDRVIEEVKELKNLGVDNIAIADDNFGTFYERDKAIFERLLKEEIKVYFWAFMRVDMILNYPDLIKTAAQAGLKEVLIGFESVHDEELKIYNKQLNKVQVHDYQEAYRLLKEQDIMVFGSFVENTFLKKINNGQRLLNPNKFCDISMHMDFAPVKETSWFDKLAKENLIIVDTFYYHRYIPSYKQVNRKKDKMFFWKVLRGILNEKVIGFVIFGPSRERKIIGKIYWELLKNLLTPKFKQLVDGFILINPKYSPLEKQRKLVERYINEEYIRDLLKNKES